MVDVFEEVEERIRSDRYKALALNTLPWIAGAVVVALLAVLGWWGYGRYQAAGEAKASEQYAQALDAFNANRHDAAYRLFGDAAKSPSKGYRTLALMQQGGMRIADGKIPEAVALLDQAAAAAPNPILADGARLKAAYALLDSAPYKELDARLTPLTKEGRPYRAEAREALAFGKLMAGDMAGARSDFVVVSLFPGVSDEARARAQAAMAMIDSGAAKNVPAVVKAALALPPPVQLPAGADLSALPSAPQQTTPGPQ